MESSARSAGLRWPEFAGGSPPRQTPVKAAICPVVVEQGEPCFSVTVDQRWLCGSQGELIFFNTMAAASRFLHLVKVPVQDLVVAPPQTLTVHERQVVQCFRLSRHGLTTCNQCRVGQQSCVREAREYARQDDRW